MHKFPNPANSKQERKVKRMLTGKAEENISLMKQKLNCGKNFDIVYRTININSRLSALFFVDGFAKDEIIEKLMEYFYSLNKEDDFADVHTFSKNCLPYFEVSLEKDSDKIVTQVLSGVLALFIDGFEAAVLIDARTYPQRDTSEPEKDKTLRGSKDGFVETLVFNTALIRRRIRSRDLCCEHMSVGKLSKTDLSICYLSGKADEKLLRNIRKKLSECEVEALTMNQESVAEILIKNKWYNPLPKFKYTERPDTASAQILEGDVVILVDNSPSAMILPVSIFDIMEDANDYYLPPITGTYLRLSRLLITFVIVFLTPTWLMLMNDPLLLPNWATFLLLDVELNVPLILQLLIMEVAIDGLKLAALNTPNMLTTAFSLLGAIILGDFAVQSGWFVPQAMLYMAVVAIGNYTQPSYEMGYALKFFRIILLFLVQFLGWPGLVCGTVLILLILIFNRTPGGKGYLYPLIPFNGKELKRKIIRQKLM